MSDKSSIWAQLQALADGDLPPLNALFQADANRAARLSYSAGSLFADFSKQRLTTDIHAHLLRLAQASGIERQRDRLFAGDKINTSENRAVLHPALRGTGGTPAIRKQVADMRARTAEFAGKIREAGTYKAIVHIGIGGSDLGPRLCADALAATAKPALDLRFSENIDGASINDALAGLEPETTLVITVSKSFTTQETRMNSEAARDWLGKFARANMVAVTANKQGAIDFGIPSGQIFEFWDWVGGRFSLWSAVGLSLQITYGPDVFDQLLAGAAEMDTHFIDAPLENNLPIMLAMTGIWNRNFLGYANQAVVPYARRLRKLSRFLQQLEMESNGKCVTRDGNPAGITCPVIWGDEGSNSQHAFFQFLHQSRNGSPVDFFAILQDNENRPAHTRALLANCFAQSEALMTGKSETTVRAELTAQGLSALDIDKLAPQKTFPGNRPSTTIVMQRLDTRTLGNLLALYEHKVFVQSVIWDINAFDQWGVELGKVLAGTILDDLGADTPSSHDSSTAALIALAREAAKS